ncbi:MAG: hypothetical protein KJ896_01245, partial [Nanoarchaeota archaeon]|nr:hypothetical protein [Nanoarchaeota archaeon]
TEQKLELSYVVGPCVLEKDVEDFFYRPGNEKVHYTRRLQAVARIVSTTSFWKRNNPDASPQHLGEVLVKKDTMADGTSMFESDSRKIGMPEGGDPDSYKNDHIELTDKIAGRFKESFPAYDSQTKIEIDSAEIMKLSNFGHERVLAEPYIDQIVDRTIEDARKILGEVK